MRPLTSASAATLPAEDVCGALHTTARAGLSSADAAQHASLLAGLAMHAQACWRLGMGAAALIGVVVALVAAGVVWQVGAAAARSRTSTA